MGTKKSDATNNIPPSMKKRMECETALVNAKSEKRSNLETTRSVSFCATQPPNSPARERPTRIGKTHVAARTVPLSAHVHQNEAKLRSNINRIQTSPNCRSKN